MKWKYGNTLQDLQLKTNKQKKLTDMEGSNGIAYFVFNSGFQLLLLMIH